MSATSCDSLLARLDRWSRQSPEKVVFRFVDNRGKQTASLTYAQLRDRAAAVARALSAGDDGLEAGARAGVIAPDETTFEYIKGRPMAPPPDSAEWEAALAAWRALKSDEGAVYEAGTVVIDAADIAPTVTWGTSPQDVAPVTGFVPVPDDPARGGSDDPARVAGMKRSLECAPRAAPSHAARRPRRGAKRAAG